MSIQVLLWAKEEGEVTTQRTGALGYAGGMLSQRGDQPQGWAHLGWPPTLQWQVRAGARGEREGRRTAPGRRRRRRCHGRSSCTPWRSPPAGGRWPATPPALCGTAPGVVVGTAAGPPADVPQCCHLPPHSPPPPPPLPPHRPEVTRQGSDSAGTRHELKTHT